jgi:thymidylate kinase
MASTQAKKGKLIVFEGVDGAGKTTVSTLLAHKFSIQGISHRRMALPERDPGTLGELVYRIHHAFIGTSPLSVNPTSVQLLHVAAHVDAIHEKVIVALARGEHVILDRYWWSTWVYGKVLGANQRALKMMIRIETMFWKNVKPSVVFLLERNGSLKRKTELHQRIQNEYRKLARLEKHRYPVIALQNDESLFAIQSRILKHLSKSGIKVDRSADDATEANATTTSSERISILINRLNSAKPTPVYDTYWRFAAERQAIFFRRIRGETFPWTKDPVLREYKFTNAYRASDRVSQYLIRNVIYAGNQSPREIFFRTILFKIFNRIETWELLVRELGKPSFSDWSFSRCDNTLSKAMAKGERIYSAAYIMPTGKSPNDGGRKHRMHLKLIEKMMRDRLPERLMDARSLREAFQLLRGYPTIGDFLAYQYVIDLNYSPILNFSEMEFVMPGPGALNGIKKCFSSLGDLTECEIIRAMTERQDIEFERLGLKFESLWGRPLQLIDCQNLFCEVDKYSRVVHPEFAGVTGRKRIKQKYKISPDPISYWYPPKWGLNELIAERVRHVSHV